MPATREDCSGEGFLQRGPTDALDELNGNDAAPVTIVLADDHAVVRSAVRSVLEAEADFEVVAEAGDVGTTVRKVLAFKPNVLGLDLNMPGGSSVEAIPKFLEVSPRTAIVVLTMDDDLRSARAVMRAGTLAFVLKEAADTELVQAARAAARRHKYLNPEIGARVAIDPEPTVAGPDGLTNREIEVLRLLTHGYTNTEIAHQLCLSARTIEAHRAHIHHKIHRRSRAEMSAYARDHALVD